MTEQTNINAASTQDTNTASTPTQTGAANPGSTEAKLFTQAELEKHINARIEKAAERDARIKAELLSQLGLDPKSADFDALKSTIEDARKRADAEKSAEQRLVEVSTKKDETITQLQQQIASLIESQQVNTIEGELKSELAKMKAISAKAVLSYIRDNHKDAMRGLLDEDGKVNEKKMADLLETVKKEESALFGDGKTVVQATVIPSNANGRASGTDPRTKQEGVQGLRQQIKANF